MIAPLDKAQAEAMLALAAAINRLVDVLPKHGLGGYASPLFTVQCQCSCRSSNPHQPPYTYSGGIG